MYRTLLVIIFLSVSTLCVEAQVSQPSAGKLIYDSLKIHGLGADSSAKFKSLNAKNATFTNHTQMNGVTSGGDNYFGTNSSSYLGYFGAEGSSQQSIPAGPVPNPFTDAQAYLEYIEAVRDALLNYNLIKQSP